MLVVVSIHNYQLGVIVSVESEKNGKFLIRQMVERKLKKPLNKQQRKMLKEDLAIYARMDQGNEFYIALGEVE